jgi:hypothetical protein
MPLKYAKAARDAYAFPLGMPSRVAASAKLTRRNFVGGWVNQRDACDWNGDRLRRVRAQDRQRYSRAHN